MKAGKAKQVNEKVAEPQTAPGFVSDVPRSETEVIRVSTKEYKGVAYLDLRVYFRPKGGEEYLPTKKGITVRQEQIHELAKAVCLAEEAFAA